MTMTVSHAHDTHGTSGRKGENMFSVTCGCRSSNPLLSRLAFSSLAFLARSLHVDHRWIFLVLERASVPLVLRRVLRVFFCNDSFTSGEHAGASRLQFALMGGVRPLCPASGFWFTMPLTPSTGG